MDPSEILFGRQVLLEVFRAGRREARRLLVQQGIRTAGPAGEALSAARRAGVAMVETDKRTLDRLTRGGHHQGMALECNPYPFVPFKELPAIGARLAEPPFLLVLDHLNDPQNVGSLFRTAEAAGVHGVVLPRDRAAGVTPAVVRASSGAAEHLAVAQVSNLGYAMDELRKQGIWIWGLETDPDAEPYTAADFTGPLALVIGSEGEGLSRLVRDRCDGRIRLPMRGRIGSLNAAVSGALALYRVRAARDAASTPIPPADDR